MAASPSAPALHPLIHVLTQELCACDRQGAIEEMAAHFARRAALADARPLVDSALQREATEPTYLGKGMAMPHARVEGLVQPGICIAHSAAGIPWHEESAHLVAFIAVPEEQPELYLHLMARLIRWRLQLGDTPRPTPAWEQELREALA